MANTHTNADTVTDHSAANSTRTEKAREAVSKAQDTVQDISDTARLKASYAVDAGVEHAQTVQNEFDSAVRRSPTLAVLGALGVGVALGLMLNRRD